MKKFKIKSYCKINLFLKVLKKLSNGYHSIISLITFCNIYDLISISNIKSTKDKVIFSGPFKKGISPQNNTITQVLNLMRKSNLLANQNFKINIYQLKK